MSTALTSTGDFRDNGQLSPERRPARALSSPRKRAKVERETPEFRKFVVRQFDAYERRVSAPPGDIDELRGFDELHRDLDERVDRSARALHYEHGYSWGEIAKRMGTTRQAARQRWGMEIDK